MKGRTKKVADGINRPALFNMRKALKDLPVLLIKNSKNLPNTKYQVSEMDFLIIVCSNKKKLQKLKSNTRLKKRIHQFIDCYFKLIQTAENIQSIKTQAELANREDRITGNALIQIVNEIVENVKKGLSHSEIQNTIDNVISKQMGYPEVPLAKHFKSTPMKKPPQELYLKIVSLVETHQEDI
jgi:hypothetical protein